MVKNYLLVSIRNLVRYKIYSAINILGLAIAITSSILIFGYVFYYDTYISHSNLANELNLNDSSNVVYGLTIIALLILIIAVINFINLSIARSLRSAKEIGIRKIAGAEKLQLISQFLFESVIINIAAATLVFLLADTLAPQFFAMVGKPAGYNIWENHTIWSVFGGFFIIGSLIIGLLPVAVVSRFKPVDVLKSKSGQTSKGNNFRKLLVIIQFTATIILLSSAIVIYKQTSYLQILNTGINVSSIQENQLIRIFYGFSIMAIVIACLGLLGLILYMTERRAKEIGIRRVIGANRISLYAELSKGFSYLLIISMFIGIPASFYFANAWLANYPFKITLSLFIFVIPVVILTAIALFTIVWTVNKTTSSSTIDVLK